MGKQSSRMYGIKVKERVNYYEFGTNDGCITLYYIENLDIWQVKAGKHDQSSANDIEWWYNGHSYNAGDTIESFNDGDIVTLHILESHIDTTPYTNYMYDIFGNASENIQYGNKDVKYSIMPGKSTYSCKVTYFENGMIKSSKEFDSEDIRRFKEIQPNDLYPVYNMKFDWHGMDPQSGYPQMSFQAISNSDYIKYNNNTISKGETIRTFQAVGFTGFEVVDDTNKYTAQNKSEDAVPSIHLCKRIGGSQICVANKDKKNIFTEIFHDHKEVYYNGHYHDAMYLVYDNPGVPDCWKKGIGSLSITYVSPYWFLMANKAGVQYGGRTYEARKLIRSWLPSDSVDMTLKEITSRKKENAKDYNKMVYDITKQANVDQITVIWQEIIETKDGEGHTIRRYVDLDTITFTSSDSPVTFHNLQYRFDTTKWTIISKCGYIKYDGKTYVENRAVLSFNLDEDVHIEITDETNKYYVQMETTYIVKTPSSDVTVSYELHTAEGSYTMKIVKTNGAEEEPWVTVNFYDAIYSPFEYDDISLIFDTIEMKWELYSNDDNLYYNGTSYSKGSKLGEWAYKQIVKIGNIIVTHENHDALQVIKQELTNGKLLNNNDIDQDFAWHNSESVDFHLSYSYAKGLWTIKAVHDCWCEGVKYTEGQIIKQFKTRVFMDPFSIMFPYQDDPGSPVITNILYSFNVNIDIDGVTTIAISSNGHNTESYSDKDISHGKEMMLTFSTKDASSMYGYIWRKYREPGPTPIDVYTYFFVPIDVTGLNGYRYIAAIRVSFGHRQVLKFCGNSYYNRISVSDEFFIFNSLSQVLYHYHGYFPQYKAIENPLNSGRWSYIGASFPPYPYSGDITYRNYKKVYLNKNNQYMYIVIREDEELVEEVPIYTYTIKKLIFTSENMSEVISETTNSVEYGLYEDFIYAGLNAESKLQYLDNGDSLIVFDNMHEFIRFYDWWEPQYVSGTLSISSLSFEKLNVCRRLDITRDGIIDRTKQLYPEFADSESYSSSIINIGRIDKYMLCAIRVNISYDDLYAYVYFAYKYNIETGGVEYIGNFARKSNNGVIYYDDIPWKDVMFTFNGKGYNYSRLDDTLYVYEISDPEDFDEVYVNNSWILVNTLSESACEVSIIDLQNYTYRTVNLYSAFGNNLIKSIGYNTSDSRYHHYNNEGIFVWENLSGQSGKLITYLPDPTLNSFSAAFCFPANALRYSNELNEEWFQND